MQPTAAKATRTIRLAIVQPGDFLEAQRLIHAGEPEPYFAMGYSVKTLESLVEGRQHLVISLDAPAADTTRGDGRYASVAAPRWAMKLPRTLQAAARARRINAMLRRFEPTHVLLRTGGLLGALVLRQCIAMRASTLVVLATMFQKNVGRRDRLERDWFIKLLNDPAVFLVGNHRAPATQSMIDFGLDAKKAAAWDWPGLRRPEQHAEKSLANGEPIRIVYVGTMIASKGVFDLIDAVGRLRSTGPAVELTLAGEGPDMDAVKSAAAKVDGVEVIGRVGNGQAFDLMRGATLVAVPSHHGYPEGMPLTLTEALASRTPVIVSDHPVMTKAFRDGVGMKFFRAGDPASLADAISAAVAGPAVYRELSRTTRDAYDGVECPMHFGDLIDRWTATF